MESNMTNTDNLNKLEAQLTKRDIWNHRNGNELWFVINGVCKIAAVLPSGGLFIASAPTAELKP